jgi:transposase
MLEQVRASEQGTRVSGEKRATTLQMAESVLKNAGHKMHAKNIAAEIEKQFGTFVKPTSLGTMLYRAAIERKKLFKKDKDEENTYSLLG